MTRMFRAVARSAAFATAIFCLATSAAWAQQPSAALQAKGVNAAALLNQATTRGHVRIIVDYKPAAGSARSALGTAAENIPAIISENQAAQDPILSAHFGAPSALSGPDRALRRMEISPSFAINATAAEIESLANDARVTQIRIDGLNKPLLIQSVPLIGMTNAYTNYSATGANWAVAVLDTGVAKTHEFITGKVISEACYSSTNSTYGSTSVCPGGVSSSTASGSGVNCDITVYGCEHGTHVAGIAAGFNTSYTSGEPTNGVAKGASIIAVQVFSKFFGPSNCGSAPSPCVLSFDSDMQAGLDRVYALRSSTGLSGGIASINMSIGGGNYTSNCDSSYASMKTSIDNLRSAGIATVIAAGNSSYTNQISFPACISTAIAVAATDKSDVISYYTNINSQVAVFAPGGGAGSGGTDILSSVPSGYMCTSPASGYCYLAGTSMATPHVAGAFAAIRSVIGSGPSVTTILNALINTGKSIADTRSGGTVTKPRIKVDSALGVLACTGSPTLAVTPQSQLKFYGPAGGPFYSDANASLAAIFTLSNTGAGTLNYTVSGPDWLTLSGITSGSLACGQATSVMMLPGPTAISSGVGNTSATVSFTNTTNGLGNTSIAASLVVFPDIGGPPTMDLTNGSSTAVVGKSLPGLQ